MGGRRLRGPLPEAIGALDELRFLMVSANNLTGPLPAINYSRIRTKGPTILPAMALWSAHVKSHDMTTSMMEHLSTRA